MPNAGYDPELGEITPRDYEYAEDLLADLEESPMVSAPERRQIVAEWLRKTRYEAVVADRNVATQKAEGSLTRDRKAVEAHLAKHAKG